MLCSIRLDFPRQPFASSVIGRVSVVFGKPPPPSRTVSAHGAVATDVGRCFSGGRMGCAAGRLIPGLVSWRGCRLGSPLGFMSALNTVGLLDLRRVSPLAVGVAGSVGCRQPAARGGCAWRTGGPSVPRPSPSFPPVFLHAAATASASPSGSPSTSGSGSPSPSPSASGILPVPGLV